MNDETSPGENGPGETSPGENGSEDAHIRALLAELGSGPDGRPMPPEVASRLDETLARLVAERASTGDTEAEPDPTGTVVPLRRQWLSRATAAAAAVIVVGAGGVAAANLGVFGNGASMSSDSGGGSAADGQVAESAPHATPTSPSAQGQDDDSDREPTGMVALPRINATSFASDVTSLLRRSAVADLSDEAPTTGSGAGGDSPEKSPPVQTPEEAKQAPGNAFRSSGCPGPTITDGAVPNPIQFDGELAVLVIHPKSDGEQLVEAWNCAGDRRLAETTITP